ncbi:hypothetical protein ERD78_18625 [Allopusillimonas soli]|uniref:Uncharacterized protein n=1 Tax=Allopusillimonas soli TaxID=659016 RepID=A0A853FJL1_9BURK|nr:hypothetical protein [Allopusillimonas soli]NYT38920.1 hypothetical protein [Allopusillimonas soli]TEA70084.1 hypothetical protein ERD78_18625 [Allopusillimonas soli]
MQYVTESGHTYHFDGWPPGQSPYECWARCDYLGCLHGAMLCYHLIGDGAQEAVADDGLLHELVHLASGMDICTHTPTGILGNRVRGLERRVEMMMEAARQLEKVTL